MNLRKTLSLHIDAEGLKDLLKNNSLDVGDELEIDGDLWRVLKTGDKTALIWKHTGLDVEIPFNKDGTNKYEGSDLEKACREYEAPQELKEFVNGGFFPLSIEEVKELLPSESDRIATDKNGETTWWWTRSACRGYGCSAWSVLPAGIGYYGYAAHYSFALAPACAIC